MAVREIIRMGHPTLRRAARPLRPEEVGSEAVEELIEDMVDTLRAVGGIGLAAPQVNVSLRLALIEIGEGPSRYGELPKMPLSVYINPEIEVLDPTLDAYWEACLSVPGLRGRVSRPRKIRVKALDRQGREMDVLLDGFVATVFQHEFDHLDGRLFVDTLDDPRDLLFEDMFDEYVSSDLGRGRPLSETMRR